VVTGVLLALGPAWWSTRMDVTRALNDGDHRAGGSFRSTRTRRALVSIQVCVSMVLVIGAALFVRSLDALGDVDLAFDGDRLVAMDFDVEPVVANREELPVLAREALRRVNALPGVVAAAMSNRAPVDQSTPLTVVQAGGHGPHVGDVTVYLATERYFETVGVSLIRGRRFTADEVDAAADVVIVNESLAQRLWAVGDPLERWLHVPSEGKMLRVVGVARDSKYRTLTEANRPHIYRPAAPTVGLTLLARTRENPRATLRAIQTELDAVGPGLVGFFPRTFDDHVAVQLLPMRAAANAASLLGALALVLSAAALYGLVSWFVVLRRREIGVRMALGASVNDVRCLVVRQALMAAAPGMVAGTIIAVAAGALARAALFGISPLDPVALGGGVLVLVAVVLAAGYWPSRAATAVDPATLLRH
jgi:predicted permease